MTEFFLCSPTGVFCVDCDFLGVSLTDHHKGQQIKELKKKKKKKKKAEALDAISINEPL